MLDDIGVRFGFRFGLICVLIWVALGGLAAILYLISGIKEELNKSGMITVSYIAENMGKWLFVIMIGPFGLFEVIRLTLRDCKHVVIYRKKASDQEIARQKDEQ